MKLALSNLPPDAARRVAEQLVREGRVAAVNMHAIESVYVWKGEFCETDEVTLVMHVAAEGVDALRARLLELHPYELMSFVVLDVDSAGSLAEYIDFVRRGTTPA